MRLRPILLKELSDFVQSAEYQQMPVVPISPQRAFSHSCNPRAKAEDLVLVLIYDEQDVMQGYLGVLPDELHFATGTERVGWLSCMWVNPLLRGKGISKKLIQAVFEAWDYRILVTEFTPAAKGLYDSTRQFIDLARPMGLRCYLRPNLAYLLPAKNEKWKRFRGLLRFADACLAIPFALRRLFWGYNAKDCPTFQYVPEIDEEAFACIETCRKSELMNRQLSDFQWITRYPWLISGAVPDAAAARYHFSSVEPHFSFLIIKIYDNSFLIGVVMLSIRGKNLKVPYAYFLPQHAEQVAKVIYRHLFELKLDMLTVFHPLLCAYFQSAKTPFMRVRGLQRHYIISKKFEKHIAGLEMEIQAGDADAAFT